jgi:hypothetical protein
MNQSVSPLTSLVLVGCFCSIVFSAQGGDAVAVGYTSGGTWTAVTYYSSSTPKGGTDYKNSVDARAAALQDLRRRAGENAAKSEILASSDLTTHAVVARAETQSGKDVIVVGYGKSEAEAEKKAANDLKKNGATAKQKIMYRYFSHGEDSAPRS